MAHPFLNSFLSAANVGKLCKKSVLKEWNSFMKESRKDTDRPNIFAYHDYRRFLTDWFEYLKRQERRFSLRTLAQQSGTGHTTLSLVLSGQRKLTDKAFNKLLPNLHLEPNEISFLRLLCKMSDASDYKERAEALKKIQRFEEYKKNQPKEFEVFRYMTKWYYVAIREMAAFPDFQYDAKWIQSRLSGTVILPEIEKALGFLIEHEFLPPPDQRNSREHRPKQLVCQSGVYQVALRSFHQEMLKLTAEAIDRIPKEKRRIFGYTFAVSRKNFEKVSEILNQALQKIEAIEKESTEPDAVYHVTFAAVPLAENDPDKGEAQ